MIESMGTDPNNRMSAIELNYLLFKCRWFVLSKPRIYVKVINLFIIDNVSIPFIRWRSIKKEKPFFSQS